MWEGPRKKGQGVHVIAAGEGVPSDRLEAQKGVCLPMDNGQFDEKLSKFLADVDSLRDRGRLP